jgi:L-serine dehydratase
MAAIYGAKTDDAKMYRQVFQLPEIRDIEIKINRVDLPEVQRIRIDADEKSAFVDARNRGGGRVALVDARPSLDDAIEVGRRLGIEVVS